MFESLNPLYFYPHEDEMRKINNDELFDPKEATIYGNSFKNEYIPYRNYVPGIKSNLNQEEKLLLEITYYSNICHDIGLYLCIYPNAKNYIELYEKYTSMQKQLEAEYVNKYGPLAINEGKYKDGYFSYITMPSPWIK